FSGSSPSYAREPLVSGVRSSVGHPVSDSQRKASDKLASPRTTQVASPAATARQKTPIGRQSPASVCTKDLEGMKRNTIQGGMRLLSRTVEGPFSLKQATHLRQLSRLPRAED